MTMLSPKSIPQDIIDWIRTVRPVHRCKPDIFQSILLHGHVMSREYMENLKNRGCVIHSILQHALIQEIEHLRSGAYKELVKEFITSLVETVFHNKSSNQSTAVNIPSSPEHSIRSIENDLLHIITPNQLETIKSIAIDIATSSIELQTKLPGIRYDRDKILGTHRTVFSILGPHSGQYGDIFIVFKREILHHPDANFSIQSATSYASGNAFKWRPWLEPDPKNDNDRIKLFHETKLHAAVPGYEYATAAELIAVTNWNNSVQVQNIGLTELLRGWGKLESHKRIEAHLPQLIPLDYIQHVYMTQEIFDEFTSDKQKLIQSTFKNNLCKIPFQSREKYEHFVSEQLIELDRRDPNPFSKFIQGSVITMPSTNFRDHYVLPLTISQAFKQYKIDHSHILENHATVYIYWQVMNGDMMLTLSNEQIDSHKNQSQLKCLITYLAGKPSIRDSSYHEEPSYLNIGHPLQHQLSINSNKYIAKSTRFYVGCNTDDFMTFCLEIHRSSGKVILSHAGPNTIYNQQNISYAFSKERLNLSDLEYIHVSAGAHPVSIRNLYVTFEDEPKALNNQHTVPHNMRPNPIHHKLF